MNRRNRFSALAAVLLLLSGTFVTGTQEGRAAGQPLVNAAYAVSVGPSPATGHVFVVSNYFGQSGPKTSWVTMVDARSYKALRVVRVADSAVKILVNDRTGRAFVVHTSGPRTPTLITVLDTRTGTILRRTSCGQGMLLEAMLSSQANRLVVFSPQSGSVAAPFTLHVLDTATGKHVGKLTLPRFVSTAALDEATARLYLASATEITIYDLRTLKIVGRVRLPDVTPLVVPDSAYHRVLTVSGKEMNVLTVFGERSGKVIASTRLGATRIAGIILDRATNRVFVVSEGAYTRSSMPASDGMLRVLARNTYRVLRTVPVGVVFSPRAGMALDPRTQHLFVRTYGHLEGAVYWRDTSLVTTIDARSGKMLAATPVLASGQDNMTLNSAGGRLYSPGLSDLVGHGNNIVVLSTQSGRTVHLLTLPDTPPK